MSLTLHYHPLSSFCWKALIALYENDTPFEPRLVDLGNETERAALLKLWPVGKFPVLRDDAKDRTIPESSIIIEYLDSYYPGPHPIHPRGPEVGAADAAARPFLRSLRAPVCPEDRRRPVAAGRQKRSARGGRSQGADSVLLRHDRQGGRRKNLGNGRSFQPCRLRCVACAFLRQQGDAVRRHPQKRHGLFQSPEGAAFLRACDQGSGALFCHVPAGNLT